MDFILKLVDKTPYVWWKDGQSTTAQPAPFYCKTLPSHDHIIAEGTNCAGLINLLQLSRNLPIPGVHINHLYAGGTYIWFEYLDAIGALIPIDTSASYPVGSLLVRKYRSPEDQGHVAVLYTSGPLLDQQLLHSYPDAGIKIDATVRQSHNWIAEGYYEYICVNWFYRDLPPPVF